MRPLSSGRKPSWEEIADRFEGIEAVNGDHGDQAEGYYRRLAADLGVAAIGGSDVHSREAVGRSPRRSLNPSPTSKRSCGCCTKGVRHPVDLRPAVARADHPRPDCPGNRRGRRTGTYAPGSPANRISSGSTSRQSATMP
ncbi:MAG: hypothetical protein O3B31_03510 [Chloroflexi bacterium]|nr:hypothetical protein [Chloroflexota bacterium]